MGVLVSMFVFLMVQGTMILAGLMFLDIWGLIRSGRDEKLYDHPLERAIAVGKLVFAQKKVLEDPVSGLMHILFLYGFFTLGIGHTELVLYGLTYILVEFQVTPFLYETFLPDVVAHLYHLSQDVMAFLVIAISAFALGRRWSGKVKRLMPRSMDAEAILWFIIALYVTFFLFVGTNFANKMHAGTVEVAFQWYAPFSSLLAVGVFHGMGEGLRSGLHWLGFWTHLSIFLGFAIYIPMSKHMHLVFAGPNIWFFKERFGLPPAIDFETAEKYGIDRVYEFSWKTLLDTFACTECGRCNAVCPAHLTGKPLQPKKVLHDIKENLRHHNREAVMLHRDRIGRPMKGHEDLIAEQELPVPLLLRDEVDHDDKTQVGPDGKYLKEEGQIHLDTLWACTTCGACADVCPVSIDSVPGALIGLRQNMVMMEADFPQEMTAAFKGMENQANPWGVGQDKREEWIEELDVPTFAKIEAEDPEREVEYLFWVGCAGSTDDRAKKTQKAMVKILKQANVDYAILGCEESCTGDPARRMGNEYVYDALARTNVEVLNSKKFKKIFTTCPHCFNSIANDYKDIGGDYTVQHHTELLAELIKDGKVKPKGGDSENVVYHDPCYLGRYNQVYDAPRDVLGSVPGVSVSEMELTKRKSFCCGAGGGRMWMEEHVGTRVNVDRTEQAMRTGAKTIAVGCPFCMTMITDGTKAKDVEEDIQVVDIAEVVADRL
jgi:Fe-S oxidoreductase